MREAAHAVLPWVGTPFHWEASLRGVGVDCRGLLTGVARDLGRPEADTIEAQLVGYSRRIDETALLAGLDRLFVRRAADAVPQPGEILAFRIQRKVQHLGIALGADSFVHAYSHDPARVLVSPLDPILWRRRLAGVWAWRHIGMTGEHGA